MNIKTYLDYEVILANQAQPVCFAVRFEAPSVSKPRPVPGAFCIVLDRSGSMGGPPLEKAKSAAKLAVKNLRPDDQFGLVVFDDRAQVLVPLQKVANGEQVTRSIEAIHSGGSTNLTGGWSLGRDELKKAAKGTSRRLMLLSDGQLNHGIVEPEAVRHIVAGGLENHSVRTSCLGFGDQYNEDLMTVLAQVTGGQFYDADSPEKFPAIFESELDGLQKLAVQNLRLRVRRLDFCETVEPFGNCPAVELSDGWTELSVGDLVSGESRVLCFQLGVMALPCVAGQPVVSLQGEPLLQVQILWDEIKADGITSETFEQTIRVQATQNLEDIRQQSEILPWVALQKAGKTIDAVTTHMDKGNVAGAIGLLNQTIAFLKRYGPAASVAEAVQQLERLLSQVETGDLSLRERKLSKYRSHSLRKMSSHELWSAQEPAPSFKRQPPEPPIPPPGSNAGSV